MVSDDPSRPKTPEELPFSQIDRVCDRFEAAGNSIGMKLVLIPPGEFLMGAPDADEHAWANQKPQHRVKITEPFYLSATEVTQEQYQRVMGENPSKFTGDPRRPVETVSWADAVEFYRRLSKKESRRYFLPTEAQWEYASRAGSTTKWCFGESAGQLGDNAWHKDNSGNTTHPVAQKKPNAWGVYDMYGNVSEWCADRYLLEYYRTSPLNDPSGPTTGLTRVVRGGGWYSPAVVCDSAVREGGCLPEEAFSTIGFRVCLKPPE